jgi:hypothetical protein
MQYTAFFVRAHLTKTRQERIDEKSYDLPVHENTKVTVSFDRNPTDPEHKPEFIKQALVAYEVQAHDPSDWHPPVFRGAREIRPPAVALPLLTPTDSPAYILALASARQYPTLYGNDEFTVLRVWENWFFTIGSHYVWTKDGALLGPCGTAKNPTKHRTLEAQVKAAKDVLAEPFSQEYLADLDKSRGYKVMFESDAFPPRPISVYPLSRGYARVFSIPENVEPSFLAAAVDLCRYFLHRPVWECCAYQPAMRQNVGQSVYDDDLGWRSNTLADGATYRAAINDAYGELIVGKHRARIKAAGFPDEGFEFDTCLPPQWVSPLPRPAR